MDFPLFPANFPVFFPKNTKESGAAQQVMADLRGARSNFPVSTGGKLWWFHHQRFWRYWSLKNGLTSELHDYEIYEVSYHGDIMEEYHPNYQFELENHDLKWTPGLPGSAINVLVGEHIEHDWDDRTVPLWESFNGERPQLSSILMVFSIRNHP